MPWKDTCSMEERLRFVLAFDDNAFSISELSRQFGISRKTAYKWLDRYEEEGVGGLADRACAPGSCPHALAGDVIEAVLEMRRQFPTWGPKKIKACLEREKPERCWPAASTIGELLTREGLTRSRRKRRRVPARTAPLAHARQANDLWCMDLKGHFPLGNGTRCEPFTLLDASSCYLLRCRSVARHDTATIWPILAAAFREFGLPLAIRSDNGPPFGSTAAGRLSPLGVKLVKSGVLPDHIDPGSPQQNGRLERFHRTLKEDTASPPAFSLRSQALRFVTFGDVYNERRPHEALGMDVPAAHYEASERVWSGRLCSPDYDEGVVVRRVRCNGEIRWRGKLVYLAKSLAGEPVGIDEIDEDLWRVDYGPVHLGTLTSAAVFERPPVLASTGGRKSAAAKSVTHAAG